jgi:hypothetical protein
MSPPKPHTDADAKHTTVRLTPLDHEAIHEISKFQRAKGSDRTRKNDILVDALRHFLKHITGKTMDDIKAMQPQPEKRKSKEVPKVTEITSSRQKR